jgi:hypothetical protein
MNYSNANISFLQLLDVYRLVEDQIDMPTVAREVLQGKANKFCLLSPVIIGYAIHLHLLFCADLPSVARDFMLSWSDSVLSDRRY